MTYNPRGHDEPVSAERVGDWSVMAIGKDGLIYVAPTGLGSVGIDASHVGRTTMDRVVLSVPL
jgi:hypothetical protein